MKKLILKETGEMEIFKCFSFEVRSELRERERERKSIKSKPSQSLQPSPLPHSLFHLNIKIKRYHLLEGETRASIFDNYA